MRGRVGAVMIAGALVLLESAAVADVDAGARVETVEVPRDLGSLPRAAFDWMPAPKWLWDAYTRVLDAPSAARDGAAHDRERVFVFDRAGKPLWQWRSPPKTSIGEAQRRDGGFVVRLDVPGLANVRLETRTFVFVEAPSGRIRWRRACPDARCSLFTSTSDDLLIEDDHAIRRLSSTKGALGAAVPVGYRGLTACGDDAVSAELADSPIELSGVSLSRARPPWKTRLSDGHHLDVSARCVGDALVVLSPNRLDILTAATGATRYTAQLPDVRSFDEDLGVLPDGRVVALVEVGPWRFPTRLMMLVDPLPLPLPRAAKPVTFWALADDVGFVQMVAGPPAVRTKKSLGLLKAVPDAPLRASSSLAADVDARLTRMLRQAKEARDVEAFANESLDLRTLQHLDRADYEAATIALLDRGAALELPALARLLAGPTSGPAARAALARALDAVSTELPRTADRQRQLRLIRASLSLLEATPGPLPEAQTRAIGVALGALLRSLWPDLSAPMRAAFAQSELLRREPQDFRRPLWTEANLLLKDADRYLEVLWRAPYADLDRPLREAVAAVGSTRPCPPARRPLTVDETIVADLAWSVLALRAYPRPVGLSVSGSSSGVCFELPTLGGPVTVGDEQAVQAAKAKEPTLEVFEFAIHPLSDMGRAALAKDVDRAALGEAPLREATWDGRRLLIARVAGRWREVRTMIIVRN